MFSLLALIGSFGIVFLAWMIAVIAGLLLLLGYVASRADHELREKKLHGHINLANQAINNSNDEKNERLQTVSHQLKTPLTAVTGYASMLLDEDYGRLNAAQIEAITEISESGKRATKLVNALLVAGAVEKNDRINVEQNAELVQIRILVSSILQELKQNAEQKKLYMYFDQANSSSPTVRANEINLRQALLNVIDNAITYTAEGGVTVRMVSDTSGMRLSVQDTGAGIHEKDQAHIFDKFYRGEYSENYNKNGNGLGMYISRKIIEQHGGTIWIESEGLGKGSTFHIWLPVVEQRVIEQNRKS